MAKRVLGTNKGGLTMEENYLYQKISESIRQQMLDGRLKPGDRLPSLREMTAQWDCTLGTVQRAYQELARQGLIVSHVGQGTHVIKSLQPGGETILQRLNLMHRCEAFLLEIITSGYTPQDAAAAFQQALERWQVIRLQPMPSQNSILRFAGSHDPALAWLSTHFPEIVPSFSLQLGFTGSLGGLIALAEGKADLAGCHLWDEESDSYNVPFVRRLLPGKRVALLTLAHRNLGLILPQNNTAAITGLKDLTQPGLRFINRQAGSGTRVWLDAALRKLSINTSQIQGYATEKMTHTEVASAIVQGQADTGFGLEAIASEFGLDFIFLVKERYDLVIPEPNLELSSIASLASWLSQKEARAAISSFVGYSTEETGLLRWIGGLWG
jgi:putative molybdopterin biosynthesis protein